MADELKVGRIPGRKNYALFLYVENEGFDVLAYFVDDEAKERYLEITEGQSEKKREE